LDKEHATDGLRSVLTRLETEGAALGHFNVSDLVMLKVVVAAAGQVRVPVLVGASKRERDLFGVGQLAAVVNSLRAELDVPIFLNADHTHSLASSRGRIGSAGGGIKTALSNFFCIT
jgi:fructose-bisphosphate aldolase class II